MSVLLAVLFILFFLLFIGELITPSRLNGLLGGKLTRKTGLLIFGILSVVFFALDINNLVYGLAYIIGLIYGFIKYRL